MLKFENVSLLDGLFTVTFYVVPASYFDAYNKDASSLYLRAYCVSTIPALYRGKQVEVRATCIYNKKITLVSGNISNLTPEDFPGKNYKATDLIKAFDQFDINTKGSWGFNDRSTDANYNQFAPVIQKWLGSYDINALLVEARKAYIQGQIEKTQQEFDKAVKLAADLEQRLLDLNYYNEV